MITALLMLVPTCYLLIGYFFLRWLKWFHQAGDLIYMAHDPLALKVLLWALALVVWPSFLFDLGEALLVRRNHRKHR